MKFIDNNEEARHRQRRISELFCQLKTEENAQLLEEFTVLLSGTPASAPVPGRRFGSNLIEIFYRYLFERLKLKEGVCYDYSKRVERICKELGILPEDFANGKKNIDEVIALYTRGGDKYAENVRKHNAPSAALKKFKDFLERATYPNGTPVAAWRIPYLEDPEAHSCDGVVDEEYEKLEDEECEDMPDEAFAQAHIYLHETEGEQPIYIAVKHCAEIRINNRQCLIVYRENGKICDTVDKVINDKNYADLIRLMRRYYNILNSDRTPATVAVPFGGVHTYEYEFEEKTNYGRSHKLFNSSNHSLVEQAYANYNKIIANIINQ